MPNFSVRPLLDESFKISIGELRRAGALVRGELRHGELLFNGRDGQLALRVEFAADLRKVPGFIELRHVLPDQPAGEPYRVELVEIPMVRRSDRVRPSMRMVAVCPSLRTHARALYCPPGADRFLSSAGHQLVVPSDRIASRDRALYRLQLARQRLERAAAPKARYRGSRGAEARTLARLAAAVADAELRAWSQTLAKPQRKAKANE